MVEDGSCKVDHKLGATPSAVQEAGMYSFRTPQLDERMES